MTVDSRDAAEPLCSQLPKPAVGNRIQLLPQYILLLGADQRPNRKYKDSLPPLFKPLAENGGFEVELNVSVKQTQILSPQLIQSMEILQMSSQELREYIDELALENPTVELEESQDWQAGLYQAHQKLEWLETGDHREAFDRGQEEERIAEFGVTEDDANTLYHYICDQIPPLEEPLFGAVHYLAESLNSSGWLDEPLEELAKDSFFPLSLLEKALDILQSLEPAGVGARCLRECLLIQLSRLPERNPLACLIAAKHLDALSKNRFGAIAKATHATQEEVREACALIRKMNPRPGAGFDAQEKAAYITPDIIVVPMDDHMELLTNDSYFPTISVSGYYRNLLGTTEDPEVKEYLLSKIHQTEWVIRAVEQRRNTLLDCVETILKLQKDFFCQGPGHLVPMTLSDVGAQMGVHESTVSRAVRGKYIQCHGSVYPMQFFFSRGLGDRTGLCPGGSAASPDYAKSLLKKLVEEEDKKKPLSDQKLCQLMAAQGCDLSRRTVAKYRDELGIPSTTGRKEYE